MQWSHKIASKSPFSVFFLYSHQSFCSCSKLYHLLPRKLDLFLMHSFSKGSHDLDKVATSPCSPCTQSSLFIKLSKSDHHRKCCLFYSKGYQDKNYTTPCVFLWKPCRRYASWMDISLGWIFFLLAQNTFIFCAKTTLSVCLLIYTELPNIYNKEKIFA